jgi:Taurine catabolism dioxygenase TauD, TfdA family
VTTLPPRQDGPAAWLGREMAARTDWILELQPDEVHELEAAAVPLVACGNTQRLVDLGEDRFRLPTLGARLRGLREELLGGRGFALVRGLRVERYTRLELAAMFLGLGAHLGNARSQNAKGHVLGHVFNLGVTSEDPNVRLYQTCQRQTFHTDSCDVVGLLCLQTAMRGGDSLLVSGLTIFNSMRAQCPELLTRLLVPMPHDRRGEVPAGMKPYFDVPVYSWLEGQLTVFYQRQYFDSAQRFADARRLTEEDVRALDRFDALANDESLNFCMRLEPGDMQFVHNHDLLHDRTAFDDWAEPDGKRHLLRLWLACPGARPLPASFEPRYGSIEVGNRGGIMVPGNRLNVPLEPV